MKEYRILKGHKKEVCCKWQYPDSFENDLLKRLIALAWHPLHPILVSGGSEGSILYWDTAAPEPPISAISASLAPPGPRATLSQAHDSNVWALSFHPLGHLLASASNDHTTRFWARERPGDATSNFSGGGEKPPTAPDGGDGGEGDDDDDMAVPGFAYMGAGAMQGGAPPGLGQWWGKDEEQQQTSAVPYGSGVPGLANDMDSSEDMIPGFGRAAGDTHGSNGNSSQQNAPPPFRNDTYGGSDEWNNHRGQGHGYNNQGSGGRSRWGPRRSGGGGRY